MIVSCERCGARYKLDDGKVTERGAKITCPRCRHVFVVYPGGATEAKKQSQVVIGSGEEAAASAGDDAPKKRVSAENLNFRDVGIASWKVRVKIGLIYDFGDIKTLRKYLAEGRVTSDDVVSHDGKNWKPIGEIPDLDAYFVQVYEEARRIRDERSKSMFDDEDPTHIVGMGSIGSNLAAQALRTVSEPAPNIKGASSVVSPSTSSDDLASVMAAALDAENDGGGGGGGAGLSNPEVGPQFADPFASMRNKQQERLQSRRTPSRPTTSRAATRPTPSAQSSGGGSSALKTLPLVAAILLLLGGGAWYFSDLFLPPAGGSAANGATVTPVRQAPKSKQEGALRDQVLKDLEEVEPLPMEDEDEDEEINFDELTPVRPSDAEINRNRNNDFSAEPSGGTNMVADAGSPGSNGDLYFAQGNYSAAATAYGQAGGALSATQHGNYGIALYQLGRYEEALNELNQGAGSQVLLYRYKTKNMLGDPAGAKTDCYNYINATGDESVRAECDSLG